LVYKVKLLNYSFNKSEKLKSKILIDKLFKEGKSVSAFPLRLVYIGMDQNDSLLSRTGVSVSKRNFKRAVDRNRIKRLMREAYRLHRPEYLSNILTPHAFMILYIGKQMPTLQELEKKMVVLFEKVSNNKTTS
jgi:ribonuclease P protein component